MKPQPLIAPLLSVGDCLWWKPLVEVTQSRLRTEVSKNDDYLLPVPNKDRSLFVPRPCNNSKAIRWMRMLLSNSTVQLSQEEIKSMTVSSFRVFMPSLAHQHNVAKERRQYLGRWTEPDTADVYTREHRVVVTGIWKEVLDKLSAQQSSQVVEVEPDPLPAPVPTDLIHPSYDLDVQSETVETKEFPLVPALGKPWPAMPVNLPLDKPPKSKDVRKLDQSEYFLVVNPKKSGMPRKFRVHWFNDDLKCIGCRFSPSKGDLHPFMASDWDPNEYAFCQKAARVCAPPTELLEPASEHSEEGSDMGELDEISLSSLEPEDLEEEETS